MGDMALETNTKPPRHRVRWEGLIMNPASLGLATSIIGTWIFKIASEGTWPIVVAFAIVLLGAITLTFPYLYYLWVNYRTGDDHSTGTELLQFAVGILVLIGILALSCAYPEDMKAMASAAITPTATKAWRIGAVLSGAMLIVCILKIFLPRADQDAQPLAASSSNPPTDSVVVSAPTEPLSNEEKVRLETRIEKLEDVEKDRDRLRGELSNKQKAIDNFPAEKNQALEEQRKQLEVKAETDTKPLRQQIENLQTDLGKAKAEAGKNAHEAYVWRLQTQKPGFELESSKRFDDAFQVAKRDGANDKVATVLAGIQILSDRADITVSDKTEYARWRLALECDRDVMRGKFLQLFPDKTEKMKAWQTIEFDPDKTPAYVKQERPAFNEDHNKELKLTTYQISQLNSWVEKLKQNDPDKKKE
jgi:hypothetical protein